MTPLETKKNGERVDISEIENLSCILTGGRIALGWADCVGAGCAKHPYLRDQPPTVGRQLVSSRLENEVAILRV